MYSATILRRGEKCSVQGRLPLSWLLFIFFFFLLLLYSFNKLSLSLHCFVTFSLLCLQTLSPSTALSTVVLHSQLLSLSLCLPSCHSHFSPTAPGPSGLAAFEVLTVVTGCGVTRVSKQSQPSWISSNTIWMAFPLSRGLSQKLIGCRLSQWELASHWGRWICQERMWVFSRF